MPILSRKSSKGDSPTGTEPPISANGFGVYDGESEKETKRKGSGESASFFPRFGVGGKTDRHTGRGEHRKDKKSKRSTSPRQAPNLDRLVLFNTKELRDTRMHYLFKSHRLCTASIGISCTVVRFARCKE